MIKDGISSKIKTRRKSTELFNCLILIHERRERQFLTAQCFTLDGVSCQNNEASLFGQNDCAQLFKENEVFEILSDCYESVQLDGDGEILNDIDALLRNNGVTIE